MRGIFNVAFIEGNDLRVGVGRFNCNYNYPYGPCILVKRYSPRLFETG